MRILALHGLGELIDDVLGCRQIGISHPKINDVLALRSGVTLEAVGDAEDIGGEPLYSRKFVVHSLLYIKGTGSGSVCDSRPARMLQAS